jgi:hypothetical protein
VTTGNRIIKDDNSVKIGFLALFLFLCIGISCLILFGAKKNGPQLSGYSIFVFLLACGLPAVPGILLLKLVQYRSEFGIATLVLDSLPVKTGEKAAGEITVSRQLKDFSHINVRVCCNQVVSSGKSRQVNLLWDMEQSVDADMVQQFGEQTVIPVSFTIPVGCKPTKTSLWSAEIRWGIQAEAVPRHGQHFRVFFSFPVVAVR